MCGDNNARRMLAEQCERNVIQRCSNALHIFSEIASYISACLCEYESGQEKHHGLALRPHQHVSAAALHHRHPAFAHQCRYNASEFSQSLGGIGGYAGHLAGSRSLPQPVAAATLPAAFNCRRLGRAGTAASPAAVAERGTPTRSWPGCSPPAASTY